MSKASKKRSKKNIVPCECGATFQGMCICDFLPDLPQLPEFNKPISKLEPDRDLEDAFRDSGDLEDAFREDDEMEAAFRNAVYVPIQRDQMDPQLLMSARRALESINKNEFKIVVSRFDNKKYNYLEYNPYFDFLLEVISTGKVEFVSILLKEMVEHTNEYSYLYSLIINHAYDTKNIDMVSFLLQYLSELLTRNGYVSNMLTLLDQFKSDMIPDSTRFYKNLVTFVDDLYMTLLDKNVSYDDLYGEPEQEEQQAQDDEKEDLFLRVPSEMELPRNLALDPSGMIRPRPEPVRPVQANPGRIRVSIGQQAVQAVQAAPRPMIRFEPRNQINQADVVMPRAPFRPMLVNGIAPPAPVRIASRFGKKSRKGIKTKVRKVRKTKRTKHGLSRKEF
jgi:hypothetical protein